MSETKNKSKEQEVAEADVEDHRKDLGPFVVAAETTRMAMVFTDAKELNNPIVFANDSFLSLTGFDRAELLGRSFNSLLARGADIDVIAQVTAAFRDTSATDPEVHYTRIRALRLRAVASRRTPPLMLQWRLKPVNGDRSVHRRRHSRNDTPRRTHH